MPVICSVVKIPPKQIKVVWGSPDTGTLSAKRCRMAVQTEVDKFKMQPENTATIVKWGKDNSVIGASIYYHDWIYRVEHNISPAFFRTALPNDYNYMPL